MSSNNDQKDIDSIYRLLFMKIFSLSKSSKKTVCPSDNDMANFSAGFAKWRTRKQIIIHLNNCTTCYNKWISLPPPDKRHNSYINKLENIYYDILFYTKEIFRVYKYSIVPVVSLAAVFLFLWTFGQEDLTSKINITYKSITINKNDTAIFTLSLKNSSSLAFNSNNKISPINSAFGAGLFIGKNQLGKFDNIVTLPEFLSPKIFQQNSTKWNETPWSVFCEIGRWVYIINYICHSETIIPENFWKEQKITLNMILKNIELQDINREDKEFIKKTFAKIDDQIQKIVKNGNAGKNELQEIIQQIEFILYQFTPNKMS